jgi:glycosyltransferase involved in cell wall biosynthesis
VAVVSDLREERWYAMDLVAEMLLLDLRTPEAGFVRAIEVRPRMTRRLTRLPLVGSSATADTADRILNRVWDYPRWLHSRGGDFDLFHITDHSYAHLAMRLPAGRSLVTCHDLDALRGVLPGSHGGSVVERALGRRLLKGMRAARKILCVSAATRNELVAAEVVPVEHVAVVPNGVHPAYSARSEPGADREAVSLLGPPGSRRHELLHVGSTIPRKRLDVLLNVVSVLRRKDPGVRLIQVGGALTASQRGLASSLGLDDHIAVLPFVNQPVLAAIYRRAVLLLQTSDREGFGLPVAEAMTCGTPVVASDLPVLREVGGPATTYCPVGDVERWAAATAALLEERASDSGSWHRRQADGIVWSQRFNWQAHASAVLDIYCELLSSLS